MKTKNLILIIVLLVATLACSLAGNPVVQPPDNPPISATAPEIVITSTFTPIPTLTPAAGCGALWYDNTYQAIGVRDENSANNYLQETSTQVDDGNTTGAYAMDVESRKFHKITATGNITAWTITGATPGEIVHLEFVQDGGGGRTLALGAGLSSPAGVTLTPNAAAGAMSFYIVVCLTATTGIVLPFRG